jgi:hypothetical protein
MGLKILKFCHATAAIVLQLKYGSPERAIYAYTNNESFSLVIHGGPYESTFLFMGSSFPSAFMKGGRFHSI